MSQESNNNLCPICYKEFSSALFTVSPSIAVISTIDLFIISLLKSKNILCENNATNYLFVFPIIILVLIFLNLLNLLKFELISFSSRGCRILNILGLLVCLFFYLVINLAL